MGGWGICTKCVCNEFKSDTLPMYDPGGPSTAPGWFERAGKKCMCGHYRKVHADTYIRPGLHGAIATCVLGSTFAFRISFGHDSQEAAAEAALRKCQADFPEQTQAPVVRISGANVFLAVADASDGTMSWFSGQTRKEAERGALANCQGQDPEVRISFHTSRGEEKETRRKPTSSGQRPPLKPYSDPAPREMQLVGIRMDLPSNTPAILLKESHGCGRYLPIWVNDIDAGIVESVQQGRISRRPLTHQLFCDILAGLNVRIMSASINSLTDGDFRSDVTLSNGSKLNANVSDAVILTLLTKTPIYAAAELLNQVGVENIGDWSIPQSQDIADADQVVEPARVPPPAKTSEMIELEVVGVQMRQPENFPMALVKEKLGGRYLPIWVGAPEAIAVAYAQLGGAERPHTHDLVRDVLKAVNIRLLNASIMALKDEIFFADLNFSNGSRVSARPSDAYALVLLTGAPLYITAELLAEVGVEVS